MDENTYPNGDVAPPPVVVKEKVITEADKKRIPTKAISVENSSASVETKSPSSSNMQIPDGPKTAEKATDPVASSSQLKLASDNGVPVKVSPNGSQNFSFGDRLASSNEPKDVSPPAGFSIGDKVPKPNASPISGFGDTSAPSKAANAGFPISSFNSNNGNNAPKSAFFSSSPVTEISTLKTDGLPFSKPESSSRSVDVSSITIGLMTVVVFYLSSNSCAC